MALCVRCAPLLIEQVVVQAACSIDLIELEELCAHFDVVLRRGVGGADGVVDLHIVGTAEHFGGVEGIGPTKLS